MRKIIILLGSAALITATSLTYAQRDHVNHMVDRMVEKLELNTTQTEQVKSIMAEQQAKRQALREETKTKLQAVLTEEQMARMEEMHNRHKEWRADKGKKCLKKKHTPDA